MHRQHHRWWSPSLGRNMDLLEFGHAGARVIAFPTSMGSFFASAALSDGNHQLAITATGTNLDTGNPDSASKQYTFSFGSGSPATPSQLTTPPPSTTPTPPTFIPPPGVTPPAGMYLVPPSFNLLDGFTPLGGGMYPENVPPLTPPPGFTPLGGNMYLAPPTFNLLQGFTPLSGGMYNTNVPQLTPPPVVPYSTFLGPWQDANGNYTQQYLDYMYQNFGTPAP